MVCSRRWSLVSSANLFPLAFVAFLSTSSYLLGIYLHARGAAPRGGTHFTTTCHHRHNRLSTAPLDFSLHHPSDALLLHRRRAAFPLCAPSPAHHTKVGGRCLVPAPEGYRVPVPWPESREVVWVGNVEERGGGIVDGERLRFGGGAEEECVEEIAEIVPVAGGTVRTAVDVGSGVRLFFDTPK